MYWSKRLVVAGGVLLVSLSLNLPGLQGWLFTAGVIMILFVFIDVLEEKKN